MKPEPKAYFGLCVTMGTISVLPKVADYWSDHPFFRKISCKASYAKE